MGCYSVFVLGFPTTFDSKRGIVSSTLLLLDETFLWGLGNTEELKVKTTNKQRILNLVLGLAFDDHRKSTLQLALEQARHLIGYDKEKGVSAAGYESSKLSIIEKHGHVTAEIKEDNRPKDVIDICDAFSALSLYLIALDQLGHLFVKGEESVKVSGILKKAKISEFRNEDIRKAIKQLRNSLCHNFGLANCRKPFYKFTLDFYEENKVIEMPMKGWNGEWSDKSEETQTTVYVFPLCNAIEKAIESVITQYEHGEIQCVINEIEEVKSRFTILRSF